MSSVRLTSAWVLFGWGSVQTGYCSVGGVGSYDCFESDLFYHHSKLFFASTVAGHSVQGVFESSAFFHVLAVVLSLGEGMFLLGSSSGLRSAGQFPSALATPDLLQLFFFPFSLRCRPSLASTLLNWWKVAFCSGCHQSAGLGLGLFGHVFHWPRN